MKQFLERMSVVFENGTSKKEQESASDLDRLDVQLGQLKVENVIFWKNDNLHATRTEI